MTRLEVIWPTQSVVFCKTKEKWGEFSNMCAGFPVSYNNEVWLTTEALYQSFRFSDKEIRDQIRAERSPMAAKFVAKKHIEKTRAVWDDLRFDIMLNVVGLKICLHSHVLFPILSETGGKDIVEFSSKGDTFWGTKALPAGYQGQNWLGVIWMRWRERLIQRNGSLLLEHGLINQQLERLKP